MHNSIKKEKKREREKGKKYLVITLPRHVQDLHEGNYKTLMNKFKGLNKWKNI